MTLRNITDFFPPVGIQLRSPGGLSIDPKLIVAIEVNEGLRGEEYLRLHTGKGVVSLEFYNCTSGNRAPLYEIADLIKEASK